MRFSPSPGAWSAAWPLRLRVPSALLALVAIGPFARTEVVSVPSIATGILGPGWIEETGKIVTGRIHGRRFRRLHIMVKPPSYYEVHDCSSISGLEDSKKT